MSIKLSDLKDDVTLKLQAKRLLFINHGMVQMETMEMMNI